ncbi:unnamed protein product [Trichogramma brassicae]|uniref:Uncharacterized protein n=1 Tax=Trichogramma brassicae TaxID=86971 RepID=A0A6H5HYI0_9HYME|nr:unnamed protein product [Trichogramma brassicae]
MNNSLRRVRYQRIITRASMAIIFLKLGFASGLQRRRPHHLRTTSPSVHNPRRPTAAPRASSRRSTRPLIQNCRKGPPQCRGHERDQKPSPESVPSQFR